jgi:hypothetical protein
MPGEALSMRTSCRDSAEWSSSITPTGRFLGMALENIQTTNTTANTGTHVTIAKSQGL